MVPSSFKHFRTEAVYATSLSHVNQEDPGLYFTFAMNSVAHFHKHSAMPSNDAQVLADSEAVEEEALGGGLPFPGCPVVIYHYHQSSSVKDRHHANCLLLPDPGNRSQGGSRELLLDLLLAPGDKDDDAPSSAKPGMGGASLPRT
ncbi:UNVERIFIED_CONTAM: hypothetical protein K2H54_044799 [Gekko kuhli]